MFEREIKVVQNNFLQKLRYFKLWIWILNVFKRCRNSFKKTPRLNRATCSLLAKTALPILTAGGENCVLHKQCRTSRKRRAEVKNYKMT